MVIILALFSSGFLLIINIRKGVEDIHIYILSDLQAERRWKEEKNEEGEGKQEKDEKKKEEEEEHTWFH